MKWGYDRNILHPGGWTSFEYLIMDGERAINQGRRRSMGAKGRLGLVGMSVLLSAKS
jgi:hypothetical protein